MKSYQFQQSFLFLLTLCIISLFASDNILIMRSEGDAFKEVATTITEDLSGSFTVTEEIIQKELPAKKVAKLIKTHSPKIVVLMNNSAVKSFKAYQKSLPDGAEIVPSLSLMTALLSAQMKGLKNATGISYEVPIVTSVVNLRALLGIENVKIGVVYREFLKPFITENAEYCKSENIKMVKAFVPSQNDNYKALLEKGLNALVSSKVGVNMIWVPNDPAFLKKDIIKDVWMPFSQANAIPIIVGVESMLSASVNFGTYAVLPDHIALGQQAVGLIYDIKDSDWKVDFTIVEPPISIYQVLNPKKIRAKYDLNEEQVQDVDKVLE
jgi:hypothetical protein